MTEFLVFVAGVVGHVLFGESEVCLSIFSFECFQFIGAGFDGVFDLTFASFASSWKTFWPLQTSSKAPSSNSETY